jgi:hypothetical protein
VRIIPCVAPGALGGVLATIRTAGTMLRKNILETIADYCQRITDLGH